MKKKGSSTNGLRAVGYCRTSGEGQRDNTSIPRQKEVIREYCKSNGWSLATHYVDESKTGSKVEGRDEFQQMIKDAALEKFDVIVVYDVTRFARDGADIIGTAQFLKRNFGVHVIDTKGQFDSRPGGNALLNFVYAGVSEHERLSIMERMIGGRINRAKEGLPWSGKKPFGRAFDKEKKKWFVTERGKRMRALLERYADGERFNELLKEFTEFSSAHVVLHSVRNSQLSGTYVKEFNIPGIGIEKVKIPIPAIPEVISPALEKKVRARMEHRKNWNKESLRQYLLTGFVFCEDCGKALSGNCTDGTKYYRHHKAAKECGCSFRAVREDILKALILDYLYDFILNKPVFEKAIEDALPSQESRREMEKERDRIEKRLKKLDKEVANLVDAIAQGADPSLFISKQEELKKKRSKEEKELGRLEEKLSEMPDAKTVKEQAGRIRTKLLAKHKKPDWRRLPFDEIRQYLFYLFGPNPGKTGKGIFIHRAPKFWCATFRGVVGFESSELGHGISHKDVGDLKCGIHSTSVPAGSLPTRSTDFRRPIRDQSFSWPQHQIMSPAICQ